MSLVRKEVLDLLEGVSSLSRGEMHDDMLFDELGITSLDVFQVIFEFETRYDIDIETGDYSKVKTLGEVVGYIEKSIDK
ncbi:MAG: acyl carrier protein [Pseudomonadota bacterium]